MVNVAYPVVYDALVSMATAALTGTVNVTDGYDISDNPGDVVQIGVPNLNDTASISAGAFNQEQVGHGSAGFLKETGTINGIALAWNGDGNASTARAAASGYVAALGAAIRANRKLGVTAFDLKADLGTGDIAEDKVDGATCAVSFTVIYTALIGA